MKNMHQIRIFNKNGFMFGVYTIDKSYTDNKIEIPTLPCTVSDQQKIILYSLLDLLYWHLKCLKNVTYKIYSISVPKPNLMTLSIQLETKYFDLMLIFDISTHSLDNFSNVTFLTQIETTRNAINAKALYNALALIEKTSKDNPDVFLRRTVNINLFGGMAAKINLQRIKKYLGLRTQKHDTFAFLHYIIAMLYWSLTIELEEQFHFMSVVHSMCNDIVQKTYHKKIMKTTIDIKPGVREYLLKDPSISILYTCPDNEIKIRPQKLSRIIQSLKKGLVS